jgi:hypothetical protein
MSAVFSFQFDVTADLIPEAAETCLAELRAGRPPEPTRSVAITRAVIFAQLLAVLIVSIALDFPGWLVWSAAVALAAFGLWTGLIVFVVVLYPLNRARYERQIAEGFRKLDSPWIRWTLADDGFQIESRTTLKRFGWPAVRRAFVGRTCWILDLGRSQRFLLPVSALPEGAERFLLDRLTQAGSNVQLEQGHPLDVN